MSFKYDRKGLLVAAVGALAICTVLSLGSIFYQFSKAIVPERTAAGSVESDHQGNKPSETSGVARRSLVD
jgi:hypothetical protein